MVLGSLAACACTADVDEETQANSDEVIIGANDLLRVSADGGNVPTRYRPLLDAFGQLLIPGATAGSFASCTATHVGGGIVVTAGHCFRAPATRVNNAGCAGTRVQWGLRGGKAASSTSSCTQILAMETNSARDYAVFRVDRAPGASVPVDLGSEPTVGVPLTIFSHPGGRPLEWSRTCSLAKQSGDHFGYQCDTEGGSSGAAVLRDDTLKVVGIHWGGGGSQNSATYILDSAADTLKGVATSTPTPAPSPSGGTAYAYVDGDYRGSAVALGVGRYPMSSLAFLGNDAVSSLRVPAGMRVTLFEHDNFTGRSKVFTGDANYVGADFNDLASSIVVE